MARNPGIPPAPAVPAAVRSPVPGWRDPRLWIGIALVAISVVAGARLLAAADDTVAMWAVESDLGAGDRITEDDLVPRRVRFADGSSLERYFAVTDRLPADLQLSRGVGGGELLPRAAVGSAGDADTLELPIAVDAEQVPGSVEGGSVVDVYLVPAPGNGGSGRAAARQALSAVTVVDAPGIEDTFGTTGKRQLVLAVAEADARRFFELLGAADGPVITVVRRG